MRSELLGLCALGDVSACPWPKPSIKCKTDSVVSVSRCTVRFAAPTEYRALFLDEKEDSPCIVLRDVANWGSEVPVAKLADVRWSWQERGNSCMLVGFLKLPEVDALKLLQHSGKRGVFINKLDDKDTRRPINWVTKDKNTSSEQYFREVFAQASEKKLPLVFRRGGASNLGLPCAAETSNADGRMMVTVNGVPKQWEAEELAQFMMLQKWTDCKIITCRTRRKQKQWLLQAKPPADLANQGMWIYEDSTEGAMHTICLALAPQRRDHPTRQTFVKGPGKGWKPELRKDLLEEKEELETDDKDVAMSDSKDTRHQKLRPEKPPEHSGSTQERPRSRSRERSSKTAESNSETAAAPTQLDESQPPPKTKSAASHKHPSSGKASCPSELSPADVDEAVKLGWERRDVGGAGDCMYRAFAAAKYAMESKGQIISEEQLKKDAADLRAQTVLHITKHRQRFGEHFAPDPTDDHARRNGQPRAQTLDEWLLQQALPSTWGCGLSLQGLTEKTGIPISVWKRTKSKAWERYLFAPKFSKAGLACASRKGLPLALVLENAHYTYLHPGSQSLPKPWLQDNGVRFSDIIDLTGAGSKSQERAPSSCSKVARSPGSNNPATPSVYTLRSASQAGPDLDEATPSVYSLFPETVREEASAAYPQVPKLGSQPQRRKITSKTPVNLARFCHAFQSRKNNEASQQAGTSLCRHSGCTPSIARSSSSQDRSSCTAQGQEQNAEPWQCDVCELVIYAPDTRKLSERRINHIRLRHPGVDRSRFHQIRKQVEVIPATLLLPPEEQDWTCAFCPASLPYLHSKKQLEKSVKHHYATAHRRRKLTRAAIQKARWKRLRTDPASQPTLAKAYKKAGKKRSAQSDADRDLTLGGHRLVKLRQNPASWPKEGGLLGPKRERKPRKNTRSDSKRRKKRSHLDLVMFTCQRCWKIHRCLKKCWTTPCTGSPNMAQGLTRKLWLALQAESPDNFKLVLEAWQVSPEEFSAQLKSLADQKRKCLVQHGDVERQPGPSCYSPQLRGPATRAREWRAPAELNQFLPTPRAVNTPVLDKNLADAAFLRLVEQGIEPNPGPSSSYMRINCCNTGGVPGTWRALNLLAYGTVLLLQDTPFTQTEAEAFSKAASC